MLNKYLLTKKISILGKEGYSYAAQVEGHLIATLTELQKSESAIWRLPYFCHYRVYVGFTILSSL